MASGEKNWFSLRAWPLEDDALWVTPWAAQIVINQLFIKGHRGGKPWGWKINWEELGKE